MRSWLPVVSLASGFAVGFAAFTAFKWEIPADFAPYLSVAALAGLDTVFGGVKLGLKEGFRMTFLPVVSF